MSEMAPACPGQASAQYNRWGWSGLLSAPVTLLARVCFFFFILPHSHQWELQDRECKYDIAATSPTLLLEEQQPVGVELSLLPRSDQQPRCPPPFTTAKLLQPSLIPAWASCRAADSGSENVQLWNLHRSHWGCWKRRVIRTQAVAESEWWWVTQFTQLGEMQSTAICPSGQAGFNGAC